MSRFKPGDLAIIVGGNFPNAIGTTVELLEFLLHMKVTCVNDNSVTNKGPDGWLVSGDLCIDARLHGFALVPEVYLMPLRGDDFSNELIESINQGERVAV